MFLIKKKIFCYNSNTHNSNFKQYIYLYKINYLSILVHLWCVIKILKFRNFTPTLAFLYYYTQNRTKSDTKIYISNKNKENICKQLIRHSREWMNHKVSPFVRQCYCPSSFLSFFKKKIKKKKRKDSTKSDILWFITL